MLRQLGAAARYHAPASRPASPVLLLACAVDGLVDPRRTQHLARLWQVPVALHPKAGVLRQAREWLDRGS